MDCKDNMIFIVYNDASFAIRSDLNNQSGYLLAMCHKGVAGGKREGYYNVTMWLIGGIGNYKECCEAPCKQNLR